MTKYSWKASLLGQAPPPEGEEEEEEYNEEEGDADYDGEGETEYGQQYNGKLDEGNGYEAEEQQRPSKQKRSKKKAGKRDEEGDWAEEAGGAAVGDLDGDDVGQAPRSKGDSKSSKKKGKKKVTIQNGFGEDDDDDYEAVRNQGSKAALKEGAHRDRSKPLGWSFFHRHDAVDGPASWAEVDEGELR